MAGHERLSAMDDSFLEAEDARTPLHVGAVCTFEGGPLLDDQGRFRLDDVRRVVASRLDQIPRFRQRVLDVPLGLGRPVWVDDPSFDVADHVRLTALPAPGTDEQLMELNERLQMQLLDRSRPLWEMWWVEGLQGGRVALVEKVHHALVDGVSGAQTLSVILDLTPDAVVPGPTPWSAPPLPSPQQLAEERIVELAAAPAELLRGVESVLRTPALLLDRLESLRDFLQGEGVAPPSSLNRPVGRRRRLAAVRRSLADVRATKDALGGTVNDVVLAAVSAGLRALLAARGEDVPGATLRALVPMSIRRDDEALTLGNRVSALSAPLPVGEPDPLVRLALVQEAMAELKASHQAEGAELLFDFADTWPTALLGAVSRLIVHRQPLVNVVVTNVPGPQVPLYALGARMLDIVPVVPLGGNLTVGVAILSYDGQLNLGLHADPDACGDLTVLAEGIEDGFAELAALASATTAAAEPARRRRPKASPGVVKTARRVSDGGEGSQKEQRHG
ncbi:MAG: wax ester/triacylglycerol synthase family O-acyltransferase [Acidimicrobiales bacterium]|nr:wax ester/triacylglycerol synthase family O-acyltransferase [Acidimicrobiales bacterium]